MFIASKPYHKIVISFIKSSAICKILNIFTTADKSYWHNQTRILSYFSSFFPIIAISLFYNLVMTSPCRSSGCEATNGAPKNMQARFAPYGFWRKFFNPSSWAVENFSPKALHIFSPSVSAPWNEQGEATDKA